MHMQRNLDCNDGVTGDEACTCDAGYYGLNCTQCTCSVNLTCNDGVTGDGACTAMLVTLDTTGQTALRATAMTPMNVSGGLAGVLLFLCYYYAQALPVLATHPLDVLMSASAAMTPMNVSKGRGAQYVILSLHLDHFILSFQIPSIRTGLRAFCGSPPLRKIPSSKTWFGMLPTKRVSCFACPKWTKTLTETFPIDAWQRRKGDPRRKLVGKRGKKSYGDVRLQWRWLVPLREW
jgi:hypothetical protein